MGINYRAECGVVKSTAKSFCCYNMQKSNVDMSGGELDAMVNYTDPINRFVACVYTLHIQNW